MPTTSNCNNKPALEVIFFRGAGGWDMAYGNERDILETVEMANPTYKAYLTATQHHTIWDRKELFGFITRYFRRKKMKDFINDDLARTKQSRINDVRELAELDDKKDTVTDVIDFLLRPGIAEDYANSIRYQAESYARLILSTSDTSQCYMVLGHSLGTAGAFLFVEYLKDQFTQDEWIRNQMTRRVSLKLVAPAMGFPAIRNKVNRYTPSIRQLVAQINTYTIMTGSLDILRNIPTYDVDKALLWKPSPTSVAISARLKYIKGIGHSFLNFLTGSQSFSSNKNYILNGWVH